MFGGEWVSFWRCLHIGIFERDTHNFAALRSRFVVNITSTSMLINGLGSHEIDHSARSSVVLVDNWSSGHNVSGPTSYHELSGFNIHYTTFILFLAYPQHPRYLKMLVSNVTAGILIGKGGQSLKDAKLLLVVRGEKRGQV